jgi:hypothetical protein
MHLGGFNMRILESVNVEPSPNLIETLGFSGYSIQSAIADIIDNSIAADATTIKIEFDFNFEYSSIKIIDNGRGMNKSGLIDCITIAKKSIKDSRDQNDLGRFGLGLKSATASNARVLTVTSKTKDSLDINSIKMDIDKITSTNKWEVDFVEANENIDISGTIVKWEKLTFLKIDNEKMKDYFFTIVERVEKHISKVYYEFIRDNLVSFYINGNLIVGKDPFFRKHNKTRSLGIIPKPLNNQIVEIEPFILPVYEDLDPQDQIDVLGKGLEDEQGFYVYRNKRLIVDGGWLDIPGLKIDNKSNYARIRVSIPKELDIDFNINFAKNSASVPPALLTDFKAIAKRAKKESSDNFNYKLNPYPKKKKNQEELIKIWNLGKSQNGFFLEINQGHPIIEQLTFKLTKQEKNKLFSLLSSTIPVDEIKYTGAYTIKELDKEEFENFLITEFSKLEKLGMDRKHIYITIGKEQPFSSNLALVNEILIKRGLMII